MPGQSQDLRNKPAQDWSFFVLIKLIYMALNQTHKQISQLQTIWLQNIIDDWVLNWTEMGLFGTG